MAKVIIYDSATGAIKRFVTCPAAHAAAQIKSGESQIAKPTDFTGDDTTHEIVGGEVSAIE